MSGHPSDDDSTIHLLPHGKASSEGRRRGGGGWQGEHLELEHQRQSANKAATAAAVNLEQFRNIEVGKGYQAQHVVRQATAASEQVTIQNMAAREKELDGGRKSSNKNKKQNRSSKSKHRRKSKGEHDKQESRLKRYLQSDALRRFRKELQKLEASDIA